MTSPQHTRSNGGFKADDGSAFFVTAFIPVKALAHGKSRLSAHLTLDDRIQLTYESLRHIVHVLQSVPRVREIVIISRDPQVAEWARAWRVSHIREQQGGLNEALREARAAHAEADAILVLPSDLAALSTTDVTGMIRALDERDKGAGAHDDDGRGVLIAPDRHGRGTNALLLRPPHVIDFAFGASSAGRHIDAARAAGVSPIVFRSDSISLDLDSPEDYALYWDQW